MDKGGDKEGDKRIQGKSQRGWKGPIGPGEIREDLVGWLCHRLTCGIAMPTISLTTE